MMLYEWLYPNYFPVLLRGIELWYHEPVLTTPILKLMCELAQNRYTMGAYVTILMFFVSQDCRISAGFVGL